MVGDYAENEYSERKKDCGKGSRQREMMEFFFSEATVRDSWRAINDLRDLLLKGIVAVLGHHHCSSNTTRNK